MQVNPSRILAITGIAQGFAGTVSEIAAGPIVASRNALRAALDSERPKTTDVQFGCRACPLDRPLSSSGAERVRA